MKLNLSLGKVPDELLEFARKSPVEFEKALAKGGLQLLSWATNGTSKNDSSKPPIKVGFLRGSGSVFVGNKLIGIAEGPGVKNGIGDVEPNRAISESKRFKITWGYNAVYAHRRHEEIEAKVLIDGDPKWLENHIEKDRNDTWEVVALSFKKGMGM